jgi:hypothetical protein
MVKKMQDETEWTEAAANVGFMLIKCQGESLLPYVSNKALKKEMKKRIAALKQVV